MERALFNANRGVVPVKFALSLNGSATCQLPPATIGVFRTNGIPIAANEADYNQPSDSGVRFRIDGSDRAVSRRCWEKADGRGVSRATRR